MIENQAFALVHGNNVSLNSVIRYDQASTSLVKSYESLQFEQVHSDLLDLIPRPPAAALDVGAGSGRDAAALRALGLEVTAVEPSREMRRLAQEQHPAMDIEWIDDELPALSQLLAVAEGFDFILVSAVWMHIPKEDRPIAVFNLSQLLKVSGILAITLRLARPEPSRAIFEISVEELLDLGRGSGLQLVRLTEEASDKLGRPNVKWRTVVFQRPPGR